MTTILVADEDRREDDNPDVFLGDVTCDACGRTVRISLEEGASAIMCLGEPGTEGAAGCGAKVEVDPDGKVLMAIIERACTPEALALMDEVTVGVDLAARHLPPMLALLVLTERLGHVARLLGMGPDDLTSFVAQGFVYPDEEDDEGLPAL